MTAFCRHLTIYCSDPKYITLTGPSLRSLRWARESESCWESDSNIAQLFHTVSLSGVTKLELDGWFLSSSIIAFWAIYGTQVKDLVLCNCAEVADFLLQPAFSSLERLYWSEALQSEEDTAVEDRESQFNSQVAQYKELQNILHSLPNLVQLRVAGGSFALANTEGIPGWQERVCPAVDCLQPWASPSPSSPFFTSTTEVWIKIL